jgi:hypothetical protein
VKIGKNNLILGNQRPLFPFGSLADFHRAQAIVPIKREIHTFLTWEIKKCEPDLIIVVERKGTAILRALKEWEEDPLDWPWSKVISSNVVEELPDDYFRGKRILVFDEMMRTGIHIEELLKQFRARGVCDSHPSNLHVAVFAVHEPVSSERSFAYDSFYNYLAPTAYELKRMEVVKMLQQSGSLMLDTEHMEVRVQLRCNFNEFLKALRRRSQAIVFHSGDDRTNITVFYGDDDAHQPPQGEFPNGTSFAHVVKKCRFVERASNEFAIIPIWYPSIPKDLTNWPSEEEMTALLGDGALKNDCGRFYGAALLAALDVLKWVLKDLAVIGCDNYSISLPRDPSEANSIGGYSLDHLQVMYPTLDIKKLTQDISKIEKESRHIGTRLGKSSFKVIESPFVTDEELKRDAINLLQLIRHILDQRIERYEEYWQRSLKHHPFGLTAAEIFELGTRLNLENVRTSALFDILIDEAFLVTHVQTINDDDGVCRIARTFEPDGEIVSEMIRKYTDQWGLPYGF